jgi:hypothetical protein
VQTLGKLMNFDENMPPFRNEAYAFCHMPYVGFSGRLGEGFGVSQAA